MDDCRCARASYLADELFDNVQKRRVERAGSAERHYASRPRRLLSGLLKCGWCGSGYVISGADKRGSFLRCSRMIETGLCGNRCTVGVDLLEKRDLEGIEKQLASPDLIAEYVHEYHRAWTTLRDGARTRRAQLQKELRTLRRIPRRPSICSWQPRTRRCRRTWRSWKSSEKRQRPYSPMWCHH